MLLTTAQFRFYGNLKRFLFPHHRNKTFQYTVKGRPSVKDTLEALGVPHTQIGCIFANGRGIDFSYQLKGGEKICVYSTGHVYSKKIKQLNAPPAGKPRFVIDSHLGKLVRHLRLLGFDSVYKNIFPDQEIIKISISEKRIVLTRDIGLLKNKVVTYGFFLESTDSLKQLREVIKRYNLQGWIRPFSLCLECNGKIRPVAKRAVLDMLPPKVQQYYSRFYRCSCCNKVYWKGSHYDKMVQLIRSIQGTKVRS